MPPQNSFRWHGLIGIMCIAAAAVLLQLVFVCLANALVQPAIDTDLLLQLRRWGTRPQQHRRQARVKQRVPPPVMRMVIPM
jgi:hypothetical protein